MIVSSLLKAKNIAKHMFFFLHGCAAYNVYVFLSSQNKHISMTKMYLKKNNGTIYELAQ